jgi:charged multivesicular body protein 4
MQLEQQIYSIEAANINHETLQAMKSAGDAMKTIHNGMTLEQVDNTMYVMSVRGGREQKTRVIWERIFLLMTTCREILREQQMISQEIGDAITTMPLGETMDEGDLEAELEGLEQEAMDERMLNTGPTPVGTRLEGLPAAGNTERKFTRYEVVSHDFQRVAC